MTGEEVGTKSDLKVLVAAGEVGTAAATLWPLLWLGLDGVGVLEIVGTATKLICPATI